MAGVNLIQAVINHANVRLTFSPERLKVSPLQRAHGQNHGHHHTRGQLLPPPMHYGARRGTVLPCSAGLWSAGLIVAEGLEAMGSGRGISLAFPRPPGLWRVAGELSRIRPSAGWRAGFSKADQSFPNPGGKPRPQPGLIHRLPLHGHGVGRMTGDGLQVLTPPLRQRQAAPVLDHSRPFGIFRHGSSAGLAVV